MKLGLSKIVTEYNETAAFKDSNTGIRRGAAYAVGHDYLEDHDEDIYASGVGKKVHFS